MIPLAKPWLDQRETELVNAVLSSGALIQGVRVTDFERELGARLQRKHVIAMSNGTTALSLALRVLGVGAGDEVLCPALTWPSPANAVAMLGAIPVFVDVDEHEWNSTAEHFERALSKKTKAAIVIDQFGNPARLDQIHDVLGDLPIIEDAACALGSTYADRACGSFGEISCVSFHPRKIITTGEGGVCATNHADHAATLQRLRNHGQAEPGRFTEVSGNFRLTEIAAAMGIAQLEKLDKILAHRHAMLKRYRELLPDWQFQREPTGGTSNFQTIGTIPPQTPAHPATWWITEAAKHNIQLGRLSVDASAIGTLPKPNWPLDVTRKIAEFGVALPIYPAFTTQEQDQVVQVLEEIA